MPAPSKRHTHKMSGRRKYKYEGRDAEAEVCRIPTCNHAIVHQDGRKFAAPKGKLTRR